MTDMVALIKHPGAKESPIVTNEKEMNQRDLIAA